MMCMGVMMTQSYFINLCLKKIDFFSDLSEKETFLNIFSWVDSFVYYIKDYSLNEDLSNCIKHATSDFNLSFDKKN